MSNFESAFNTSSNINDEHMSQLAKNVETNIERMNNNDKLVSEMRQQPSLGSGEIQHNSRPVEYSNVSIKEYIIITLLFSLFAYKRTGRIIMNFFPFISHDSVLPYLLILGFIFTFTLKLIKKLFI